MTGIISRPLPIGLIIVQKGQSQSFSYRQKEHNPKYKKGKGLHFPKQQQLQQEGQINAEKVLSCLKNFSLHFSNG